GLSFINGDLVDKIEFSAGGFSAIYGDKMSSVLDIKYRAPEKFKGGFSASLLGGNAHIEGIHSNKKISYLLGARYKSTNYLLGTLDTKGDYKPSSADIQTLITYKLNEKHSLSFLGNYAHTTYNIIPSTRETDFGTINQALRLTIFFDGQELDEFNTYVGAISYDYDPNKNLKLKFIGSAFSTFEDEAFTIQGQYFLDELERDLGSDAFGETAANLGVGTYIDHARNYLDAQVFNIEHKGYYTKERHKITWGARFQMETFKSELWQWNYIDSSGFSVPIDPSDQINLNNVVITNDTLKGKRYMFFLNDVALPSWNENIRFNYGIRLNHYDINKQTIVSPRFSVYYDPPALKNFTLKFSTGIYYQPPFFKEMIGYDGQINPKLRAQKSIHFIAGMDYTFLGWGREFKFVSEAYYKILDDLVPYKFDNLRIRYYANNESKGYATGLDLRINGEFVQGVESWASLSFLSTKEDIANDDYYQYFNSDGELIVPGVSNNTLAVDSQLVIPGNISRPTDQRATFSLFFQDYLPSAPNFKMNMTLVYGTGLPFGPPGEERYKDIFKYPPYRRVDIGFLYQLIDSEYNRPARFKALQWIKSMWISMEVFNLLQANNTVSYNWIKDISGRQYAVPNYLTGRQLNLRMMVKF
ncbi:MAG TPA: TonB-dependent receptor, partial [Bacteroidia bacterium]|nr:TonB-dependent receptor [Bacteroidia bacterium]